MKLIAISIGSWLIGLSAILLTFVVVEGENLSAADIKGATIFSLVISALLSRWPTLHLCSGCANVSVAAGRRRFSRLPPPW